MSPIGVDTANGRVQATHSCRILTDLGVMACYYLENGGPDHTLLSVDKLCVDSDLVYVHTKEGAYIYYRDTGLTQHLVADEGLQFTGGERHESTPSVDSIIEQVEAPKTPQHTNTNTTTQNSYHGVAQRDTQQLFQLDKGSGTGTSTKQRTEKRTRAAQAWGTRRGAQHRYNNREEGQSERGQADTK